MVYKLRLHVDINFTLVPRGFMGCSLECDFIVGRVTGYISIGLRYKRYGGQPWLLAAIGKHSFAWR